MESDPLSPSSRTAGRFAASNSSGRVSPYLLFFSSGFTALVFEVVWAKQACLIFGNTSLASATVIGSFMAGLALGSRLFGKIADQRPGQGWRLYGILEGCIALYALFFPVILAGVEPIYAAAHSRFGTDYLTLSAVRALLAFGLLVVPTTLMGGTLPLLARSLARSGQSGDQATRLYTLNLFGAAAGSFVTGYLLLEFLGVRGTTIAACGVNLAIALTVLTDPRARPIRGGAVDAASEFVPADTAPLTRARLIMVLMLLHGFSSFVVQICWVRTMGLVLGSSTYALSATLTTYLVGLALGGWIVAMLVKNGVRPSLEKLGYLEAAAGLSVLLFIPSFENCAYWFARVFPFVGGNTVLVLITQLVLATIVMVVPTILIGTFLPAVFCLLGTPQGIGRTIGRCYAFNTLGALIGAFATAFVLVPSIGIHGSLVLASLVLLSSGVLLMIRGAAVRAGALIARVLMFTVPAVLLTLYPWSRELYGSGISVYADTWSSYAAMGREIFFEAIKHGRNLIYYKDGISSTVTVLRIKDGDGRLHKSLRVNGKTDASTVGDMATQLYLGYIPLFAHASPKDVLVIGLGAGVTVGTATQFDSVRSIDCVEIEPAVVEANRFFSVENHFALKDPRVKITIGDGRNHVRFSTKKYDVIISEPSNPWIAGISSLFTREHYQASLAALNPDGVFGQWFHSYQMTLEDFQMIIRTFAEVFPHAELYRLNGSDYMLLGSREPVRFDSERIRSAVRTKPMISSDLRYFTRNSENFVVHTFLLSDPDLRWFMSETDGPVNTDDRLLLEYRAPRNLYKSDPGIDDWLSGFPRQRLFPQFRDLSDRQVQEVSDSWKVLQGEGASRLGSGNAREALERFRRVGSLKGYDAELYRMIGMAHEELGDFKKARQCYLRCLSDPNVRIRAASLMRRARIRNLFLYNPAAARDVEMRNMLGRLSFFGGDANGAMRFTSEAMNLDPTFLKNYADMAVYSAEVGLPGEALELLGRANQIDPTDPSVSAAAEFIRKRYTPAADSQT